LDSPSIPAGALSISAVSSRTSPEELIAQADLVRGIVTEELGERVLTPEPVPADGATTTVPWTQPQRGAR
ncbi:MAG TPA: hypothetical protein VFR88_01455, partial [Microlunatus sp.]|nr:hypothetical protein [Microlunatus sp.]